MRRRQERVQACPWCGTRLRGRDTCPRGPACAQEESNHQALMDQIKAAAKHTERSHRRATA